ncbi:MAG: DUF3078 domain-containing protein [Bacteroidales bacterium]|nr:DUF3078 domain-containing protein [Bacteroidales bacterium]
MKKIIVLVFTILFINCANAQKTDTSWTKGGEGALNFSQASLSNWAAGGENSISANAYLNLFINYKKDKSFWDNNFELAYGLLKTGDEEQRKSEDKIDLSSKYGYQAVKSWYYSVLLNFKSQFTKTYEYPEDAEKFLVSDFFAPAYLLYGIGMDYNPNDDFSIYISPLTIKHTFVNDQDLADEGAFGVEPAQYNEQGEKIKNGENLRNELGAFIKMMLRKNLIENVDFQTKLELFSNYSDNPQNIDVNWEVLIAMKINKFMSANINTQLIYDDDIDIIDKNEKKLGPRTQFKEVFGIGLSYKF